MRWTDRASANLLPLSRATTLAAALREWVYTGRCEDFGVAVELWFAYIRLVLLKTPQRYLTFSEFAQDDRMAFDIQRYLREI
jgi:hypothetical protein